MAKKYDAVLIGIELNPKQKVVLAADYDRLSQDCDALSRDNNALMAKIARMEATFADIKGDLEYGGTDRSDFPSIIAKIDARTVP